MPKSSDLAVRNGTQMTCNPFISYQEKRLCKICIMGVPEVCLSHCCSVIIEKNKHYEWICYFSACAKEKTINLCPYEKYDIFRKIYFLVLFRNFRSPRLTGCISVDCALTSHRVPYRKRNEQDWKPDFKLAFLPSGRLVLLRKHFQSVSDISRPASFAINRPESMSFSTSLQL